MRHYYLHKLSDTPTCSVKGCGRHATHYTWMISEVAKKLGVEIKAANKKLFTLLVFCNHCKDKFLGKEEE